MIRSAMVASCLVLAACGQETPPVPVPAPHVSATVTLLDVDGRAIRSSVEVVSMELKFERFVETDATGKATLPDLEPGRTYELKLLSVDEPLLDCSPADAIPGTEGSPRDWRNALGADRKFPRWKAIDTTFRFAAKSTVKGRVRDRDGRPVTGVSVVADWTPVESVDRESPFELGEPCDANGGFKLSGYREKPVVVLKVLGTFSTPLATTTWKPDGRPLDLLVSPGATLLAHASGIDGAVLVSAKERSRFHRALGDAVRFVGLAASERYTVWIPPYRGRYGLLENVAADGQVHEVPRVAGGAIRGTVAWPANVDRFEDRREVVVVVAERGLLQATADVDSAGKFLIDGLPPGDWTITATVSGKRPLVARSVAAVGGDVALKLEPR